MTDKKCSLCDELKIKENDFYCSGGIFRAECKRCTIKKNIATSKIKQPWKTRFASEEERKVYAKAYYAKNRDQFKIYRDEFKRKNPEYYKEYHKALSLKKKNKK